MNFLIRFLIAPAFGVTGIGGGGATVPALALFG